MSARSNDRRVVRTHRSLREAMISLVLEKGYEAVTVQEIATRADVGRSTFYAHFVGKEQLLLSGFDLLEVQLAQPAPRSDRCLPPALGFSRDLFQHVHEHRKLYRAIVGRRSGTMVQQHMRRLLQRLVCADLAPRAEGSFPLEATAHLVAGAFLAHVAWWLDHQARLSPGEADDVFRRLILPGVEAALGPEHDPSRKNRRARR